MIEVIIVVGILAVLGASVSIVGITGNLAKSRDTRRQTDLESVRSSLEHYRFQYGYYPVDLASLNVPLPTDPKTELSYTYTKFPANCDNGGIKCTGYKLQTTLERTGAYSITDPLGKGQ